MRDVEERALRLTLGVCGCVVRGLWRLGRRAGRGERGEGGGYECLENNGAVDAGQDIACADAAAEGSGAPCSKPAVGGGGGQEQWGDERVTC